MSACCVGEKVNEDSQRYKRYCQVLCERKDYQKYCTMPFYDFSRSKDWDGDNLTGRLVKDEDSVWDFCEDRVYCFLVTDCPEMNMDSCGEYMCQLYTEKYSSTDLATQRVKKLYNASNNLTECYRQEKNGAKTYFTDIPPRDRWLYAGFESKQWCDTLETKLIIRNCIYDSDSYSITCDTNCQSCYANCSSGLSKNAAVFVNDRNKSAVAYENPLPSNLIVGKIGKLSFSHEKVTFRPEHYEYNSDVSSYNLSEFLSEFNSDISGWEVTLFCDNPRGVGSASIVSEI